MENKLCLTSIIEIPPEITKNISKILSRRSSNNKLNDPHFYKPENLHITLLGLIPIGDNINIATQERNILRDIFDKALSGLKESIIFQFESFGTTTSSLFIKVKDKNGVFNPLRKRLIDEIKKSTLNLNYDHLKSYDLGFTWCTIARFHKTSTLIEKIITSKKASFGSFEVQKINIVITDKNYSKENTQKLFTFRLK